MKIETARYHTSAATFEACPDSKLPEFAFVGRSNVGKSSLINLLTGKRELANTSSVPGRTRLISFFEINESWSLVDLPGYGYAKASKEKRADFNSHVSAYLTSRENLEHVFILVDSRLEPRESDLAFIEWMHTCEVPYSVIFTKIDKSTEPMVQQHLQQFRKCLADLKLKPANIFNCSAKTNRGRAPILQFIRTRLPKVDVKKPKMRMNLSWMQKG